LGEIVDVFGFGAILDRIEEYFGRRVCGAFLLLLGLTAVVLCLHAIITLGIIPVRDFILCQTSLADALVRVSAGAVAGGVGAWILSFLAYRYFSKKIDEVGSDARAQLKKSEAALEKARATLEEARRIIGEEGKSSQSDQGNITSPATE
jgi:hypothetical protein